MQYSADSIGIRFIPKFFGCLFGIPELIIGNRRDPTGVDLGSAEDPAFLAIITCRDFYHLAQGVVLSIRILAEYLHPVILGNGIPGCALAHAVILDVVGFGAFHVGCRHQAHMIKGLAVGLAVRSNPEFLPSGVVVGDS